MDDTDGATAGVTTLEAMHTHDEPSVMGAIDAALEPVFDHLSSPGTAALSDIAGALRAIRQAFALVVYGAPVEAAPVDPAEEPAQPVPYDQLAPAAPDTTGEFTPAAG